MNIHAIPNRCIRIAGELSRTEQNLKYAAGSVEEVINSLRHSEDESMHVTAAKLSKTLETINIKIRAVRMMRIALEKIAALYDRTEAGISDHGEAITANRPVNIYPQNIGSVKERAAGTFEQL